MKNKQKYYNINGELSNARLQIYMDLCLNQSSPFFPVLNCLSHEDTMLFLRKVMNQMVSCVGF